VSQDTKGWIGVDLDGTLAHSGDLYDGEIGEPIPAMVDRVRVWKSEGKDVRLFTARANGIGIKEAVAIDLWCLDNIGYHLPLTYEKDKYMTALYDDRAIQVVKNTGELVGEAHDAI
jgi:hypothetical protein